MTVRKFTTLGWLATAALVSGCAGPNYLDGEDIGLSAKEFPVMFVTQGPSGVLKPDTPNNGCTAGPHNGCLRFANNTIGLLKFYLPGGQNKAKTCEDKVKAVITRVELATSGSGQKGDFDATPLDAWIKDEAFPLVSLTDGIVYERALDSATNQVWLLNTNANDPADGTRTFWYKVTAQACDDLENGPEDPAHIWETDPRGENTGTKK